MRSLLPPTFEPVVDDEKRVTLPWAAFCEGLSVGDLGAIWTPTFTGLTEVGTATKTGIYYRLSQKIVYFRITITPTTSTTAVAGTTYCDNFPLTIANDGICFSISSFTASTSGITSSGNRIYTSAWSAITTPVTITGIVEVV